MTNPSNTKAIEGLFPSEIAGIRQRFGSSITAAVLAQLEENILEKAADADLVSVKVDWDSIERSCLAAQAASDITYKAAPGTPASIELRFAPEDRDAILGALAALKPAGKLTVTHADGSSSTIDRGDADRPSSLGQPRQSLRSSQSVPPAVPTGLFPASTGTHSSRHEQPYDAEFWSEQETR